MPITPILLLQGYANGIFPMARSAEATELSWYDPPLRGILPLDARFHVPRRLARTVRQTPYALRFDSAFATVLRECAARTSDRPETWINAEIADLYLSLHRMGHAHSVEVWDKERLIGGLYGVSLGAAFFGESMFSRATDTSKIALVALVERLRTGGFTLLDTQFLTPHLAQFGALEIPRESYKTLLREAVEKPAAFPVSSRPVP